MEAQNRELAPATPGANSLFVLVPRFIPGEFSEIGTWVTFR